MNSITKMSFHFFNINSFFSSCIYICVTFPGRFVLSSMLQKLSLWLKFYSVHSLHDVAISILFEVCHRHFIFVELSLDITLSQLIQSGPQALSTPHLLFIKLTPLLNKKGIYSTQLQESSSLSQVKQKCRWFWTAEVTVPWTKTLYKKSPDIKGESVPGTPSIVDGCVFSFFSLEIFQMSNTSRLSRSINYSQSGLLHCEKW